MSESISEKLLKYAKSLSKNNQLNLSRTDTLSEQLIQILGVAIQEKVKAAQTLDALLGVGILCQQGASARSCDGNMYIDWAGSKYKVSEIRTIFKEHNAGKGFRKFARTLADAIRETCLINDIPGNLSKKIAVMFPNIPQDIENTSWMSDFQSTNPNCPEEIRTAILATFEKNSKKKHSKTKKNR